MNTVFIHGKITKAAEMKLVTINNEPVPVAVFTVVDIGFPNQNSDPIFFSVNYPKERASYINKYLIKDKEVNVYGSFQQKHLKDKNGNRVPHYFVRADMVELLPVFSQTYGENKND